MPASADPERTRAAIQAAIAALRDWRSGNEEANAQHLQDLGNMGDPEARARALEHVAGGIGPSAALGGAAKGVAGMLEQRGAGLRQGQASNTFTGQHLSAGNQVGFTQPKGTPVEKLFSNFADVGASTPEQMAAFRSAMLDRANQNPAAFKLDPVASTTQPFGDGMWARTDAARRGMSRVQRV